MGARFRARGVPAGDVGAPIGLPEADGVVRPDVVRVWLLMGVRLLRSGRWCGGRRGVSAHSIEFAQIVSEARPAYQGVKYNIYIMC